MPRKQVFLCCECAGTDLSINDENHKKTGKTGTRVEVGRKIKAGNPRISFSPLSTQTWQV
jgi:hypothetical protein